MKTRLFFNLFIPLLFACASDGQKKDQPEEMPVEVSENKAIVDSDEVSRLTNDIINAVPKTEMISNVLDELELDYEMALLNPIENAGKYQLLDDKAFNLGVYLSDLGYISSFDQKQEIIIYVNSAAKKLSEGIGVNDVINAETLENLELNMDNQDSLLTIIRRIYEQTHDHLMETDRLGTSAVLVTGGWLEGMHLALQMRNPENPTALLDANIQNQWEVYGKVLELLNFFPDDPLAGELSAALSESLGEPGAILGVERTFESVTDQVEALRNHFIQP